MSNPVTKAFEDGIKALFWVFVILASFGIAGIGIIIGKVLGWI